MMMCHLDQLGHYAATILSPSDYAQVNVVTLYKYAICPFSNIAKAVGALVPTSSFVAFTFVASSLRCEVLLNHPLLTKAELKFCNYRCQTDKRYHTRASSPLLFV